MCKEGWSSHKVWGTRGRIEMLAGAYFGHWYLLFSVISSLPRLLTIVGVSEAHLQYVLRVCSYLLHSAATDCNWAPCNKLLIFFKKTHTILGLSINNLIIWFKKIKIKIKINNLIWDLMSSDTITANYWVITYQYMSGLWIAILINVS